MTAVVTTIAVSMKESVQIYIPKHHETKQWILQRPELALVADISLTEIPWNDVMTGTHEDWKHIVDRISDDWEKASGFVIWAPEHSLLALASYIDLCFDLPAKPIILFSAPSPDQLKTKDLRTLGLASVLINATYVARSELAEVLVLSGSHLYRPRFCQWEGNQISGKPMATVDYELTVQAKAYHKRLPQKPSFVQPEKLEEQLFIQQWYPGMVLTGKMTEVKPRAVLLSVAQGYQHHPELDRFREEVLAKEIPLIWYSDAEWEPKQHDGNEVFLTHPSQWWVVLLTQFSFGLHSSDQNALSFITNRVRL